MVLVMKDHERRRGVCYRHLGQAGIETYILRISTKETLQLRMQKRTLWRQKAVCNVPWEMFHPCLSRPVGGQPKTMFAASPPTALNFDQRRIGGCSFSRGSLRVKRMRIFL